MIHVLLEGIWVNPICLVAKYKLTCVLTMSDQIFGIERFERHHIVCEVSIVKLPILEIVPLLLTHPRVTQK